MRTGNLITASQISGLAEAHQEEMTSPVGGQSLLSQYKVCQEINNKAISQAKTSEDVVRIKIATIDKSLHYQSRNQHKRGSTVVENRTNYNLQFDPINFMQKMPCMGDRQFLVNQSILYNSAAKNRASEAATRQKFMLNQHRGSTTHHTRNNTTDQTTASGISQGALKRLLPELPIHGGFSVRMPRQSKQSNMTAKSAMRPISKFDQETQEKTVEEAYVYDDSVQISGRGSQIDPVRCLQNIFKKSQYKKRNPGVNQIAEKYKQLNNSSRRGSRMIATANTFDFQTQLNDFQMQNMAFTSFNTGSISGPRESVPATPLTGNNTGLNFFSQKNSRLSHPPSRINQPNSAFQTANSNDIDQQQRVQIPPPATAPLAVNRPDARKKNNKDIEEIVVVNSQDEAADSRNIGSGGGRINQSSTADPQQSTRKRYHPTMPLSSEATSAQQQQDGTTTENVSHQYLMIEERTTTNSRKSAAVVMSGHHDGQSTRDYVSQRSNIVTQSSKPLFMQQEPLVSPIVSEDLTQAQMAIREKLAAMKQLFDDEEELQEQKRQANGGLQRPESSEWDLHNHKIMYEEAMQKRQKHLELVEARQKSGGVRGETPLGFKPGEAKKPANKFEMHEDELREFLLNRIAELKAADQEGLDDGNDGRFKFKASTISNMMPSGHFDEASKLQENYKNRFRNKGEKLHQRMINSQQRLIAKRTSEQRQEHQQIIEQQKKEVVSSRSRARSPSSGSPLGGHSQNITKTNYSADSNSPKARQNRRRQMINSDLKSDEALSTQYAAAAGDNILEPSQQPKPATPPRRDNQGSVKGALTLNEILPDNQKKRVHSEQAYLVGGKIAPPPGTAEEADQQYLSSEDQEAKGEQNKEDEPNTAVVFFVDEETLQGKGNYVAKVLQQIAAIDKSYHKMQKQRKQGITQTALDIISNAKSKNAEMLKEEIAMEEEYQQMRENDEVETPPDIPTGEPSAHHVCITESSDAGKEVPDNLIQQEMMRQSLEDALKQHAEQTGSKPSDVIILQVADGQVSNDDNPTTEAAGQSSKEFMLVNQQQQFSADRQQQTTPATRTGKTVVHQRSRSHSRTSNNTRLNTAEMIGSPPDQHQIASGEPVSYNQLDQQKRGSEINSSIITPGSNSMMVLNTGGQKYSHGEKTVNNQAGTVEAEGYNVPLPLPKNGDTYSAQSLKVDSEEMPQNTQLGVEIMSQVQEPLHTISNTMIDINRVDVRKGTGSKNNNSDGNNPPYSLSDQRSFNPYILDQNGNELYPHEPPAQDEVLSSTIPNMQHSFVTGSQMAYFCPKRFNRFPRFTIFFKKGGNTNENESNYVSENTVSLNADFLKFLSDKNNVNMDITDSSKSQTGQHIHTQNTINHMETVKNGRSSSLSNNNQRNRTTFSVTEIEQFEKQHNQNQSQNQNTPLKVPHEVQQWNEYLQQKKFDPFDRVVLVKGIDNQILTSFRTLKGENNTVSDTFKIVHKKFQPAKGTNSFFKTMVTQQVDKLPYQTHYKMDDLQEMDDEDFNDGADIDIYEHKPEAFYDHLDEDIESSGAIKKAVGGGPQKLVVDPKKQAETRRLGKKASREDFSSSKLQHAMTAALIDIEKDGLGSQASGGMPSPSGNKASKTPFKVLTTTDNSMLLNMNTELASNDSFSNTATKQGRRMPRPKPLNTNVVKKRTVKEPHQQLSPGQLQLGQPFGVQGVSPLTQLANNMYRDQTYQNGDYQPGNSPPMKLGSPEWGGHRAHAQAQQNGDYQNTQKLKIGIIPQNANGSVSVRVGQSTQHNSVSGRHRGQDSGGETAKSSEIKPMHSPTSGYKMSPVKLNIQSNQAQFNSTTTYEQQTAPDNLTKAGQAAKSQGQRAFMGGNSTRVKTHTTGATLLNNEGTGMIDRGVPTSSILNKTETQQNMNDPGEEKLYEKPVTPISLSYAKKTMLADTGQGTDLLPASKNPVGPNADFPSDYNFQGETGSMQKINSNEKGQEVIVNGAEILSSQKEGETDSQAEYIGLQPNLNSHQLTPKIPQPPQVNVIKSNTQIAASGNNSNSAGATDGDTTKRTNMNYVMDSSRPIESPSPMDFFVAGSPIVHQALGGRKLQGKGIKSDLTYTPRNVSALGSQFSSNNQPNKNGTGLITSKQPGTSKISSNAKNERNSFIQPLSSHVGVLQVPESLKAQHFGEDALESVAQTGAAKKGAVGQMIDKIYNKDRRMVNSLYKGNMLSTAVLTDMNRYHKLKSNTGVETKNYNEDWMKERIEEEKNDIGLSLDCAPQLQAALDQQKSSVQPSQIANEAALNIAAAMEEEQKKSTSDHLIDSQVIKLQSNLNGNLGDSTPAQQPPAETPETVNYAEMVNRSDNDTALAKPNYS